MVLTAPSPHPMNYFPRNPFKRASGQAEGSLGSVRQAIIRDILWGQPLFKAPRLRSPRIAFEPLPVPVRINPRSSQG